jgi:hypothetical protein
MGGRLNVGEEMSAAPAANPKVLIFSKDSGTSVNQMQAGNLWHATSAADRASFQHAPSHVLSGASSLTGLATKSESHGTVPIEVAAVRTVLVAGRSDSVAPPLILEAAQTKMGYSEAVVTLAGLSICFALCISLFIYYSLLSGFLSNFLWLLSHLLCESIITISLYFQLSIPCWSEVRKRLHAAIQGSLTELQALVSLCSTLLYAVLVVYSSLVLTVLYAATLLSCSLCSRALRCSRALFCSNECTNCARLNL